MKPVTYSDFIMILVARAETQISVSSGFTGKETNSTQLCDSMVEPKWELRDVGCLWVSKFAPNSEKHRNLQLSVVI